MTVHLPTQGSLECDKCGETIEVDLAEFVGDMVGLDENDLPDGWKLGDVHEHLYPTCDDTVDED